MKPIQLRPVTVLAGLVLAVVLAVLAEAAQSPGTVHQIPIRDVQLVGEIPAEWWTSVELRGANNPPELTYSVPSDRYFVVTNGSNVADGVFVDGQPTSPLLVGLGNDTRVVYQPSALLTVSDGHGTSRLWGYLEPVR